jgi:nucleotide-binding universal stress UspA family protein
VGVAVVEGGGRIVVGVDGSGHARRALDWALRETALRSGRCHLICAYDTGLALAATPVNALIEAAEAVLAQELAFARESGCEVAGRVVAGPAARALVDASSDADLLVVGSRGRGGLKGALLGSVSTACVHHASCVVVVVPPPDRVAAAAGG